MRYNKIMIFFVSSVIFSVIMRLLQIIYTVEFSTGFFKKGYESVGYLILGIIFIIALINAFFGNNTHKRPNETPRNKKILGIASIFPAVGIAADVFFNKSFPLTAVVQANLLKIIGFATILFFLSFGIGMFTELEIPKIFSVLPCVYIIIRIICDFTAISSLALISDNIFLIGGYCFILLFMLNFAKLYNNIDEDKNFRRLLATGISSTVICAAQSVPYIIVNLLNSNMYNHISPSSNLSILCFGIFIFVFLLNHFSKENTI